MCLPSHAQLADSTVRPGLAPALLSSKDGKQPQPPLALIPRHTVPTPNPGCTRFTRRSSTRSKLC